jgi:GT2 family glycosyltransferase
LDSILEQTRVPDGIVIVDASPDTATETAVRSHVLARRSDRGLSYVRVDEPLRGLTRQRNFATRRVQTDLVAFLDDDVVLAPECLQALEAVHRREGLRIAGAAPVVDNEIAPPSTLWHWRRRLGVVSTLEPGRYSRSGISTPWAFIRGPEEPEAILEGDWLPGAAFMWKTDVVRRVGFQEGFAGYANGEDLEFSLRARRLGKLVVSGSARAVHLHEPSGRPSAYQYGYTTVQNAYAIHVTCLDGRSWKDALWFRYAYLADGLLQSVNLLRPRLAGWAWNFLRGYWRAYCQLLFSRAPRTGPGSLAAGKRGGESNQIAAPWPAGGS